MDMKVIGRIHTPFSEKFGIPRQSMLIEELKGTIVFEPEFRNPDGLRGLEEYSHLWLVWCFSENVGREDRLKGQQQWIPTVAPPRLGGRQKMGVFATRSPFRPNPIGLSCVKLEAVELSQTKGPLIHVTGVDMLDGTPIYDIKPYLPYVDCYPDAAGGFGAKAASHRLLVQMNGLDMLLEPEDRSAVYKILEQDPRTAYIHDPQRVWGISYKHYNIRFTVNDDTLWVCQITK